MRLATTCMFALALGAFAVPVWAQDGAELRTQYARFKGNGEGLLVEPAKPGAKARIGVVFSHPNRDNFDAVIGPQLAGRGYRVMLVNNRADRDDGDAPEETYLPAISHGIAFLRALPGVEKVVLIGHSGGGHLGALYQNVAENGPGVCQGPEKVYQCDPKDIGSLQKPDGFVLLDTTLGAGHQMTAVDPAVKDDGSRDAALDMFAAENGFDAKGKKASYSPEFVKRYYAAQAARNNALIDQALARLKLIEEGKGDFSDDEPFLIRGMGIRALGARPYQPDLTFQSHTKQPRLVLKADGTDVTEIARSVRKTLATHPGQLATLGSMNNDTTVRGFLANSAVRATADFAMTEDDIIGVDWASSYTSTPANAEGVTVPALVVTMGCHYLIVPNEIVFERLKSTDKSFAVLEGATHGFGPCGDQYGDTRKRLFDYVDAWLSKEGRF